MQPSKNSDEWASELAGKCPECFGSGFEPDAFASATEDGFMPCSACLGSGRELPAAAIPAAVQVASDIVNRDYSQLLEHMTALSVAALPKRKVA